MEGKVLSLPFMTDDAILFVCFTVPVFAEAFWITGFGITIPFLFLMMSFHWFPEHPLLPLRVFICFFAMPRVLFSINLIVALIFLPLKNTQIFPSKEGEGELFTFWMWDVLISFDGLKEMRVNYQNRLLCLRFPIDGKVRFK